VASGHAMSPVYFTNAATRGRVRYRQLPGSIGVLGSPDNHMPIGIVSQIGRTEGDRAVRGLQVQDVDVPGGLVIVDRRFIAVEQGLALNWSGLDRGR
jgi:hypothetical protein